MAEHVASSIVGFVRGVVEAAPFRLAPATEPFDFTRVPATVIDGCYRLVPGPMRSVGAFDFYETRTDLFDLYLARRNGGDLAQTMDRLTTEAHSLVAAITREGQTRDFDLSDEGRGFEVGRDPGQSYAIARITLPLSYAARL